MGHVKPSSIPQQLLYECNIARKEQYYTDNSRRTEKN